MPPSQSSRDQKVLSLNDVDVILSCAINGRGSESMEVEDLIALVNTGQAIDYEEYRIDPWA